MIYKAIFILLFTFSTSAYAKKDCVHDINKFKCVEFIKNVDADTFTVNIPHLHPILGTKVKVMLPDVKAPSVNSKNKCAKKIAREGKKFSYNLLKNAKYIEIQQAKRSRKFAIAGEVIIDGKNLKEILLKKNYIIAKKEFKQKNWCK
jgi:micrococcal nuclease